MANTNTAEKARAIFRRMEAYHLDALDVGMPDEIEADIELASEEGTTDALHDWLIDSRRGTGDFDVLLDAVAAYCKLVADAIRSEAA